MNKFLFLLLIPVIALAGRLQDADFMSEGELISAGATAASLLNDDKIYLTNIAKTLDDAIADGDIGGKLTAKGNMFGFSTVNQECVLDKTDGKLLTVDSTATCGFEFKDAPVSVTVSAAGELQTFAAGVPASQAAPTLEGSFLVADLAEPTKMKWSDSITGLISQAMFVGSLTHDTVANCTWSLTNTAYANFPVDADCVDATAIGSVITPDTRIPAVKILNARTDGYYKVKAQGFFYNQSGGDGEFRLSDGINSGGYSNAHSPTTSRNGQSFSHQFKFSTGGDKTVQIQGSTQAGEVRVFTSGENRVLQFDVYFFPDSTSLAAVQNKQLTAKTANSINIVTNGSTVVSTDFGLTSDYSVSAVSGQVTLTYSSLGLTSIPVIQVVGRHHAGVNGDSTFSYSSLPSTTTAGAYTYSGGGVAYVPTIVSWTINKQGADVNKSQVITGTFEQIESVDTELTASNVNELSAKMLSDGTVNNENYDFVNGDCTGSAGNITCNFNAGLFTTAPSCQCIVVDSATGTTCQSLTTGSSFVNVRTVRYDGASVSANFDLICSKQGDDVNKTIKGAIIGASDLSTVCERKYLSATSTSIQYLSDLDFPATLGKKYSATIQASIEASADIRILDGGATFVGRLYSSAGMVATQHTPCFVSQGSLIRFYSGSTGTIYGNGGYDATYATVCELPDNTICTGI